MEKIMLSQIATALGTKTVIESEIREICTDTRQLVPDCMFVAIRGERFDGHDYVPLAFEKGAICAVTEKQIEKFPCLIVENTRQALLEIAKLYRSRFNIILAGITGSVGKTTTKEMTALVLSEKYKTLKTKGNLNNEIGLPKTLFGLTNEHKAAVIEMGMSGFKEIEALSNTAKPTIAAITNIGFSHIENLKSQEGILKAKLEILFGMDDDAPLVVNADDKLLYPLKEWLNRPVITYGIENQNADYIAKNIREQNGNTNFTICYENIEAEICLPCVGRHNVLNALAAFSIGLYSGVNKDEAINALKKYKADGLRQNIEKKGGQTVITDCYNASPDSMKAALSVLSQLKTDGKRIAVLGDMLELGDMSQQLHELVGDIVSEFSVDMLFTYGNDAKYISENAKKHRVEAMHFSNKEELTYTLKGYMKLGDTVLFKASRGMRLEEIIDGIYSLNQEESI